MTNLSQDLQGKLINNRYFLFQQLSNNSYNQVFLAKDLVKDRKCIVKQLHLDFCSPKLKQMIMLMFKQEAYILQRLAGKHQQISQFYNYLRDGNSLYLIQEWVSGVTLEQKLRQQAKLTESETRTILLNLLSVLEYIHSLGIVHQDIKPNNIVLRSPDNLPVLIDFGVAQQMSNCHQPRVVAGTPGYMSLEQAKGQIAYHNDLYSLGLTAIHLLTGQSPLNFDFKDFKQEKIPISRDFKRVINQAISSYPSQRFASAQEMRSALISTSAKISPFPRRIKFGSKLSCKTCMVLLILGIKIIAVYAFWHSLTAELVEQPPIKFADLFPEESLVLADHNLDSIAHNIFQNTVFTVGTSNQKILQALGEPMGRKPGVWNNSIAWSYKNIIGEEVDLGYVFDAQTNILLQAEIAVPSATNFGILQAALASLLSANISSDLKQGLISVYQRRRDQYNFTVGDLHGVIQSHHQDHIYMAVWSADFH